MTTEKIKDEQTSLRNRIEDVRGAAGEVGGAMATAGRAYASGLVELGRALGGFGREIASDANEHVRATIRARNLREVAALQAAFAQHRIEMSATHSKEFVDLARAKSEEVIAPFTDLVKQDAAA